MKSHIPLINMKPSSHRTAEESLGVEYLASQLIENGYSVDIFDNWVDTTMSNEGIYQSVLKQKDDICFVGTSSYMMSNEPTIDLIQRLRDADINVVAGGYGPTFEPKKFLDAGANMVSIGEGENTIIKIAEFFSKKSTDISILDGVVYLDNGELKKTDKHDFVCDLDTLAFPERPYTQLLQARKSTINVLSSRGCMGNCSFCSIAAYGLLHNGERWRSRSIDNVIAELKDLQQQNVTAVKFVDDSFIENERDNQWCADFAQALSNNNMEMQFRASIRADKVNMDNMRLLKNAGFVSFSCGIENGSETALRRMGKIASLKDNLNAIRCFNANDLYIQAGFILFDDKTTIRELEENYAFLSDNIGLVSKGVFSEMFAAEGTKFTETLPINDGKKLSSNKLYLVEDYQARQVYDYLKKWQANHTEIYDKVIDPISAPKAIPFDDMKKYHDLMIFLKRIDLQFMKDLITQTKNSGDLDMLYESYVRTFSSTFERCSQQVFEYYESDCLQYDAEINHFITMDNVQKGSE